MLGNFFNLDGPFFKYGSLVFDLFVLNLIWAIVSGPLAFFLIFIYAGEVLFSLSVGGILFYILGFIALVHIGPSTTALFYVTNRKVRDDDGYMMKDFFKSFRMNYKQGLIISAILTVVICTLLINICAILGISVPLIGLQVSGNIFGNFGKILLPFQLFILLEVVFISLYVFPMLARFHMKTKELIKTAFIISNKHIFTTIICVAILVGMVALGIMAHPIFFFVTVSGYALLSSYLFERVFKVYMPSEEKELEDELENEYMSNEYAGEESLAELFKRKREEEK